MTQSRAFTVKPLDNGVAVLEINVPGDAQNTLKAEFADDFNAAFSDIESARPKALVLYSTKPGSFMAGADINLFEKAENAQQVSDLSTLCQQTFGKLETLGIPVVAAIKGACLGGGLELALACSYRIAANSGDTVLGLPEVMLGLLPAGGGTQRLPRLVGIASALDMMLTGRQLKARPARKMGLVDEVVDAVAVYDRAVARAAQLAGEKDDAGISLGDYFSREGLTKAALEQNSLGRKVVFDQARKQAAKKTHGLYPAPPAIIDAVEAGYENGLAQGYATEARLFGELAMSSQSKQLRGIFHATNTLKKETFVADGVQARQIHRTGVLGAGLMGAGIALTTVNKAKLPVRLKDRDDKGLAHGVQYLRDFYNKRVKKGAMSAADASAELGRASFTSDYSGFKGLDLVVEAVFEDVKLKHLMLKDVEEHGNDQTIFASNTSSIPITEIARAAKRPQNVIGLHYFSPVEKMPLLEIITTDQTDPAVTAGCVAFGKAQGKTVIVVKDGPGFYTTRILAPYLNEATRLLTEGVDVKQVDQALVRFGFPVGPITLLDEVGVDVGTKVGPVLEKAFGERMASPDAAGLMIENNYLGRKSGRGFYIYEGVAKGEKPVNTALYELMNVTTSRDADDEEIVSRCLWMMINEAAYCLQEGIISEPMHGDIGAIFGLGFPPFRGGPFRYMDSLGLVNAVRTLERLTEQYGERFKPAPILIDMAKKKARFYQD
ncbi:short chain enoyl-CoA hydratase/3-hydroxyacyl-CoA dehydrogenase [Alcanivorax hongdengensis A-11-3]|uniref:enoyl-CoA hydratase n=1 Tax=Alcanivorax hongdengensis A-11-3 TaxID=1177179 RepID=L0WJH1_9GAMM|nr:fatty acid oxidation complex subunit alpha FadJ [Alcanivorax hongdengensis]EKF75975.1 short chain enoyl-CoA hydratase/3-hydroxyacyl-CoA dehydrogenase [Alcanivorax hongdengensis A-11-3]